MLKKLSLLLLAGAFVMTGCHHDDHDPDFEEIKTVPAGGVDFGVFNHFDHDFHSAAISGSSDRDGYEFAVADDSTVMITVTPTGGLDAYLDLYDDNLDFITGDSNGGPGTEPVIVGQLNAGNYVVVVGGEGSSTGDYDVDIVVSTLGGADFGVVNVPGSVSDDLSDISDAFDVDTFYFTVHQITQVDIFVTRLSGDTDANLQLVDQYGDEVAFVDPAGDADPAIINTMLNPGTYAIIIGANSGAGAYEVAMDLN